MNGVMVHLQMTQDFGTWTVKLYLIRSNLCSNQLISLMKPLEAPISTYLSPPL